MANLTATFFITWAEDNLVNKLEQNLFIPSFNPLPLGNTVDSLVNTVCNPDLKEFNIWDALPSPAELALLVIESGVKLLNNPGVFVLTPFCFGIFIWSTLVFLYDFWTWSIVSIISSESILSRLLNNPFSSGISSTSISSDEELSPVNMLCNLYADNPIFSTSSPWDSILATSIELDFGWTAFCCSISEWGIGIPFLRLLCLVDLVDLGFLVLAAFFFCLDLLLDLVFLEPVSFLPSSGFSISVLGFFFFSGSFGSISGISGISSSSSPSSSSSNTSLDLSNESLDFLFLILSFNVVTNEPILPLISLNIALPALPR